LDLAAARSWLDRDKTAIFNFGPGSRA